jgi:TolB-like protein
MQLLDELRRRNVLRMAGLYLVGAWLITQVASTLLPLFDAPTWVTRSIVILLAIGFVPALVFSWIYELTPDGLKRDADVPPDQAIGRETGRRIDRAIIAVLLAALGYFAVDKFVLAPRHEGAPATVTAGPAAAQPSAASDKSIAVLPLANEGGNADEQYFSDGLSEDLITALSQFAGLKVIGRNSSFQFRNSTEDSRTIGMKLGVAHLLEGSVRRAGDVVRITAELVNASDGSTLWSQRYDRPYQDLFKLQDDITGAVAAELKAKLLTPGGATVQSDRPPSGSLEAYNALLQGNFQMARDTEAGYRAAVRYYSEAVRIDARYASAFAALSTAQTTIASAGFINDDVTELQKTLAQARAAATTALALEPDNASAHSALGTLHAWVDLDWVKAEVEYRRAVELAPGNAPAKFDYGYILAALGRLDDAVGVTQQGLAIDSLNHKGYYYLAFYLVALHRLDEAAQASHRALELQPESGFAHMAVVFVDIVRGDPHAALESARNMPPNVWRDMLVMFSQQVIGPRSVADPALKEFIAKYADVSAYQVAEAYALRHEPDKMFEWLERAWTNRDAGIVFLLYDNYLQPYQGDPRFAAYCRKVGLPTPDEVAAAARAQQK